MWAGPSRIPQTISRMVFAHCKAAVTTAITLAVVLRGSIRQSLVGDDVECNIGEECSCDPAKWACLCIPGEGIALR